jgi:hypothetical protein
MKLSTNLNQTRAGVSFIVVTSAPLHTFIAAWCLGAREISATRFVSVNNLEAGKETG